MTRKELRDELGSLINQVNDNGEFVPAFVTEEEANKWIQFGFEDVYKWYGVANRGQFAQTAFNDTIAGEALYPLSGDADDSLAIAWVGIKYTPEETEYRKAENIDFKFYYDTGYERAGINAPKYLETTIFVEDDGLYHRTIEFIDDAVPQESVPGGLKLLYIERPPALDTDEDVPQRLPSEIQKLIPLPAAAKAKTKMGDLQAAAYFESIFDNKIRSFFLQEETLNSKGVKKLKLSSRFANRFIRRIG
jgi:hypothetical protein